MPSGLRIEVRAAMGHGPGAAQAARAAADLGLGHLGEPAVVRVFQLDRHPGDDVVAMLCDRVLCDPVVEAVEVSAGAVGARPGRIEIGYLPGVTDSEARQVEAVVASLGGGDVEAATVRAYDFGAGPNGRPPRSEELWRLASEALANPTVERFAVGMLPPPFGEVPPERVTVETVCLRGLGPAELAELSRRRLLSLDAAEMSAVQRFFAELGRDPTDAELETLAQTWSEHCAHKTFRAEIDFRWLAADGTELRRERIDGLLRSYLRAATDAVAKDWVHSAFVDNAGIVAYDDRYDLAIKVETHNHPSALEPFGGANTGVGGVVRDVIGVSARPIACLDVLCFAPASTPVSAVPPGVLHPARVARGVVAGIGDYGNKLGLPTVAGAVVYDEGYLGNPLVYCGAVGILPRGSHRTEPAAGQVVVLVGGRTGRDGIHGATFSSATMDAGTGATAASAVQIGDPITEKGVMELVEEARDAGLYGAITDCGAGGLSSAVGELASAVGVEVDLAVVPRKYAGLAPWEVWLSEAQERMVLAVPPERLAELHRLGERWAVSVTEIGRLTGDHRLRVCHGDLTVVDLPMDFVHDGCPRRRMDAVWQDVGVATRPPAPGPPGSGPAAAPGPPEDVTVTLLAMLAHPTVASKDGIISNYDHEVRGGTLVRPWCGPGGDGPSDGVVLVPLGTWDGGHGAEAFALAVGINPDYGRLDPYRMALSAIDEVFRNLVAAGADPDRVALLDNFCWGNPTRSDRLGSLVRAAQGCHDGAIAYQAPFVSGKDSLYNEYDGAPIPPTLLITGLAMVPDRAAVVGAAVRPNGGALYLLGETRPELGGSLLHRLTRDESSAGGGTVPGLPSAAPLDRYRALHRAIRAGLVAAAHDPSEGGVAVALAELAIAGRAGLDVTLPGAGLSVTETLFSESNGRLLVQVTAGSEPAFEAMVGPVVALARIGTVTADAPTLDAETVDAGPLDRETVDAGQVDAGTPNVPTTDVQTPAAGTLAGPTARLRIAVSGASGPARADGADAVRPGTAPAAALDGAGETDRRARTDRDEDGRRGPNAGRTEPPLDAVAVIDVAVDDLVAAFHSPNGSRPE